MKAGILDCKFHSLRHTYCVREYLRTNDIYAVVKKTTHGSLDTVLMYTKFDIRKLRSDFPDLIEGNKSYEK